MNLPRTWMQGIALLVLGFASHCGASPRPTIPVTSKTSHYVNVQVKAGTIDDKGNQTLALVLNINEKYYLMGHTLPTDLKSYRLTVDLMDKEKILDADIKYPVGTIKELEGFGEYQIYRGKVFVTATFRRTVDDTRPIGLRIRMSGFPLVGTY